MTIAAKLDFRRPTTWCLRDHRHFLRLVCLLAMALVQESEQTKGVGQLTVAKLDAFTAEEVKLKRLTVQPLKIGVERESIVKRGGIRNDFAEHAFPVTVLLNAAAQRRAGLELSETSTDGKLVALLNGANEESGKIIERMIQISQESTLAEDESVTQLNAYNQKVASIYNELTEAYAQQSGKDVSYSNTKSGFSVCVTTNPAGGVIRYMLAGDYDLYEHWKRFKGRTRPPRWITPATPQDICTSGFVWFLAEWPGPPKVTHQELLHVTKDSVFVLTPTGFEAKE